MNQKQTASVLPSEATKGSYAVSSGRAESGTTTQAAEAAPAASAASQSRGADVGERLVDERLEMLARLHAEAADGVGGVDGNAHDAVTSSGRASRPSARRTARPSASSESTTSRS